MNGASPNADSLAAKWLRINLLLGTVIPILGVLMLIIFSLPSLRPEFHLSKFTWADAESYIDGILLTGLGSLWPFIVYGNIARSKLRKDSGKLLRVKGGTVAIAAIYTIFWLVLSPLTLLDMSDPPGTAQAWAMTLLFVLPVLSAIACPIGCAIGHYVSIRKHRQDIPESNQPHK